MFIPPGTGAILPSAGRVGRGLVQTSVLPRDWTSSLTILYIRLFFTQSIMEDNLPLGLSEECSKRTHAHIEVHQNTGSKRDRAEG